MASFHKPKTVFLLTPGYNELIKIDNEELKLLLESDVQPLTDLHSHMFLIATIIISILAVIGNVLVLYVSFLRFECKFFNGLISRFDSIFSRKQRFLFKTCLISLAVSDLIVVIVTATIYISKFESSKTVLWVRNSFFFNFFKINFHRNSVPLPAR